MEGEGVRKTGRFAVVEPERAFLIEEPLRFVGQSPVGKQVPTVNAVQYLLERKGLGPERGRIVSNRVRRIMVEVFLEGSIPDDDCTVGTNLDGAGVGKKGTRVALEEPDGIGGSVDRGGVDGGTTNQKDPQNED